MEAEERARLQGWVPKDEFRGDPDKWKTAEDFLEWGEKIVPIQKERTVALESKLDQAIGDIKKLTQTQANLLKLQKTTSERAYKKAVRDIQARQRQAVEDRDTATYDALEQERESLDEQNTEQAPEQYDENNPHPEFTKWTQKNMWYGNGDGKDIELTAFANGIADAVANERTDLVGTPGFYDEITRRVQKAFPDRFRTKSRPPETEGTGDGEGNDLKLPKGKSYKNLPADAKAACDDFVTQGLMTKEEYCATYFEEEG